jgi:outer membrane protein assembly factor BamB
MRFLVLLLTGLTLLLQGCASSPDKESAELEPLYFPPPPDDPRFVYERTVQASAQIEKSSSQDELRELLTGQSANNKAMSKPFDVSVCKGLIFISDTVLRSVMVFDVPGRRFYEIGKEKPGVLQKPLGLANDDECNLYVADATSKRILVYDQAGNYLKALGGQDWFDRLSHVAVDSEGTRVYAVDTGGIGSENHHVLVFDVNTGRHLRNIGKRGTEDGEFNLPRDIAVDANGWVYVVDGGNFRVQVFDNNGDFVRQVGNLGRQYGSFARPKGVAVDQDGNIYVSDAAHGNFQIFDAEGQLLLFIGNRSEKFDRAAYMLPAGIDTDEDGRIYMIDQYFRKLDIFRPAAMQDNEGFLGAWVR